MDADALHNGLYILLGVWGFVTAVLIFLMIYRGMLSNREDDQIFLDAAEERMAREQQVLVARIGRLSRPITALMVVSGVLLLALTSIWIWDGLRHF